MATLYSADGQDAGFRPDHWRDGVTTARIVWRDASGTEHERRLTDEATALLALVWVREHPRTQLISFDVTN